MHPLTKPETPRLPWWNGEPVLTWMEYVARDQPAPVGVGIPGFKPCQHCGLPMVWTKINDPVIGTRWEWRTALLGLWHSCGELAQSLEDHDAEYALIYSGSLNEHMEAA